MTEMKKETKEYWNEQAFLQEVIEHIEIKTQDGKYAIFKRLSKGEEAKIRKVTMKMVKNAKTGILEPQIDSEEYQIKLLTAALVKPSMTEKEVRDSLTSQRADELFFLYTKEVGFGNLPQNL